MISGRRMIGIEVTDFELKFVQIVKKRKENRITKFVIEALPVNVIQNGVIQDPATLRAIIKRIKRQYKLRGHANIAINSANILLRPLQMHKLPKKQLHKAIEMEITNNIQLPFQSYTYDYAWIPEDGTDVLQEMGMTEQEQEFKHALVLIIASKEMLEGYISLLKKLRLHVIGVDLAPLAFLKMLEENGQKTVPSLFIGVNFHLQFAEVSIFSDGVLRLSRNVMLNPDNYRSDVVQDGLPTLVFDEATYTADLMREVERILNFYRYTLNHREQALQEIVFAGDLPLSEEQLENAFATFFQANAVCLASQTLTVHKKIAADFISYAPRLTIPIGLALKDVRA